MNRRRFLLAMTACVAAAVTAAACGGGKKHGGKTGVTTFVLTDTFTGGGIAGVPIVLANSAGEPVTTVTTDSSGTASLHVAAGRSATVYFSDGGSYEADSYFGLADGQTVRESFAVGSSPTRDHATYQLHWHGAPPGTTHYDVELDCQGTALASTSATVDAACGADSPSSVFVFALDATNHRIGWGATRDVAAAGSGGTATVDVDVSQTTFTPLAVGHASLGAFAPTFVGVQEPIYLDTAGAFVTAAPFATLSTTSGPVLGPTARVPQVTGAIVVPGVILERDVSATVSQMVISEKGYLTSAVPATYQPDLSTVAVPGAPTVGLADPFAPTISWTNGGTDEGQLGDAGLDWNGQIFRIAYFPPGTPTSVQLPRLPPGFSAWASTGTPLVFTDYIASDAWSSYGDATANPNLPRTVGYRTASVSAN